ncbi:MAG: hypothetical protein EOS72_03150 [Mesorhizobium sp.]|uniref:hypothetical protein n=1 Tax=Mesorhizobium sp. TaxID=1871066 RepID=UPI000FE6DAC8|nr:hypothetical protein [Mesorhizobium sp.]RWC91666.1 MAG: hypothetical protein EOS72_03150 [Mesorhizobium sp.]
MNGPWTFTLGDERNLHNGRIRDCLGNLIMLRAVMNQTDEKQMRVMATAPEMLAALKALKRARGNCGASPFEQAACNLMDQAIAKAEGEAETVAALPDHRNDTVDALAQAESFIRGFEDDPMQEGVGDILAGLRAAIPREQARPDLLTFVRRMAQFTTPEDEFEERKDEDGRVYDDGISYESADELLADFSDERLGDEFATFCEMIQEARRLRDMAEGQANG